MPARDLHSLIDPGHTAVLTMELQRGVVGDLAMLPELAAEVAELGVVERTARLCAAARSCGARVVHCTAGFRGDRAGSGTNAPMLARLASGALVDGTESAELIPALGAAPADLIECRRHGVSPFGGTSLATALRHLRASTLIATGVSTNLGIIGLAIEAVNAGFDVVVATDAIAGLPRSYAEEVVRRTLSLVARRATVDEIIGIWQPG